MKRKLAINLIGAELVNGCLCAENTALVQVYCCKDVVIDFLFLLVMYR